jgi:serine/threonine protein kinase
LSDVVQLVSILERCHKEANVVHRDIKPSNFFWDPIEKQVFLNDWSCAQPIESRNAGGTLVFASVSILKQVVDGNCSFTYTAADDLAMLVHMLYVFAIHTEFVKGIESNWSQLRKLWEVVDSNYLSRSIACATACDYDGLKAALKLDFRHAFPKAIHDDDK